MSGLLSDKYLIRLLFEKQQKVGKLGQQLNIRQSNVSQHLQVLRKNGFVLSEKMGKRRIYSLHPDSKKLISYLMKFKQ